MDLSGTLDIDPRVQSFRLSETKVRVETVNEYIIDTLNPTE